jgi:hypothetical protein
LEPQPSSRNEPPAARRSIALGPPIFTWVLFFGFAYFSIAGWMRLIDAVVDWAWLSYAGVWPGPLYLALTGGLWGIAGALAVIWLWLRRPWVRLACLGAALFLALSYWLDQWLVSSLNRGGNNLPFALGITLAGLGYTVLVLPPWNDLKGLWNRLHHAKDSGGMDVEL